MQSWLGSERFGVVEQRPGEHVETEFVCVIGPVWPRRSVYVIRTADGLHEIDLRLHRRSVVLGLVRFYAWMGALVLGLPGLIAPDRWAGLLVAAAALIAIALASHRLGRLSPDEAARRDLLQRVVGIGVPPELLPDGEVAAVRSRLERRWTQAGGGWWQDAIAAGVADELLVALAEFHGEPALAERVRIALAPN